MELDPELIPHIDEASRLNNLDPGLLRALISVESNNNPSVTSKKNAGGLAQIIPSTARQYGIDDPYDPVQAIYGGARILNDNLTQAEQLKTNGRDINPVEYALKMYHGGDDVAQWGPITQAYPGSIAKRYQPAASPTSPIAALAATGTQSPVADGDNARPLTAGPQYSPSNLPPGWSHKVPGDDHSALVPPRDYARRYLDPGGVPAATPGAAAPISAAQAARYNSSDPAAGQHLPVMPSDYVFGKGKVAPPGAGTVSNGASMDGIDQLAAAGQPSAMSPGVMQLAQAGTPQMAIPSDEELLKGLQEVAPLFQSAPQASPAAQAAPVAPPAPQPGAAPAGGIPGVAPVPLADPSKAMYSPDLIPHLMTFPDGVAIAGQLSKFAEQGFQLNKDGTLSPIKGGPHDPSVQWQAKFGEKLGGEQQNVQNGAVTPMPGSVESAAGKASEVKGAEAAAQVPSQVLLKNLESNNTITAELAKSGMKIANGQIVPIEGFMGVTEANARAKAAGEQGPKITEVKPGNLATTTDAVNAAIAAQSGPNGSQNGLPGQPPGLYNDPGVGEATKTNEALYKEYAGIVANNPIAEQNLRNAAEAFRFFQSGAGAELSAKAGSWLKGAGIDPETLNLNDPAKVEEAKKAATQAIFAQMAGLKNPALGEYGMLENASAQPTLQPEAAKMIIGNSLAKIAYQNDFFQHMANHRSGGSMMGYDPSAFISGAAKLMPGYQDAAMKSLPAFMGETGAPQPSRAAPDRAAIEKEMRRRGLLQ